MSDVKSTGAIFSPCGQYRYKLWRTWGKEPPILFLMLNPSTADETENDPTVERCQRRAVSMGAGGLLVGNIFAYRSTDPQKLYGNPNPIGPMNDVWLAQMAHQASHVICGWGTHGALHGRGEQVRQMLSQLNVQPLALRITKDGHPGHPLYIGYNVLPQPWSQA